MPIIPFGSAIPDTSQALFIAPDAWISGKVWLEDQVSVFFGAVLRGDIQNIRVGQGTNIQDHAMLHTSTGLGDCIVGQGVTVGHRAILHGCRIGNNCIIGMGAIILDDAVIEDDCIIGANSLVGMRSVIPKGSLALGSPARVLRPVSADELADIKANTQRYIQTASVYRNQFLQTKIA